MDLQPDGARASGTGQDERYELIARGAHDGIWDLDLETGEIFVSDRWLEVAGVESPPSSVEDWLAFVHPEDRELATEATLAHLEGRTDHLEIEVRIGEDPVSMRWVLLRGLADRHDPPRRVAGSITDTSSERSRESRLRHQAFHDALTGLPNRSYLVEELNRHCARERREPSRFVALLFLDLVGFKSVNDHFGHDVGDEILREIGRRLRVATRPEDLPSRLGGDEFVVVMPSVDAADDALGVAERLVSLLIEPISAGGAEHRIVPSAGLVLAGDVGWTPERLIREADTAMYRAKREGSNRIEAHTIAPVDHTEPQTTRSLEAAAGEGRLLLHYQPIVAMAGGQIVGYEAVLRWRRPGRGVVPAYSTGVEIDPVLDGQLSAWALAHALAEPAAKGAEHMLAVNISRMHLVDPEFPGQVMDALHHHQREPGTLCLELAAADLDGLDVSFLDPLRRLGVRVHLDGFGEEGASLALLHHVSPDAVKLHSALTASLLEHGPTQRLVRSIVAASLAAGTSVIAPNIEVPATARMLLDFGCVLGQGNLYAPPSPAANAFRAHGVQGSSPVTSSLL